jgi:hypothetical protein
VDNGGLIKKLALSLGPTPALRNPFSGRLSLFVALGAVGIGGLTESLLPVVADPAMFVLPVGFFGHFQILLFHGENLGMAVCALGLVLAYMGFMTENDGVRSLGRKFNVPSPDLLRLGKSDAQNGEATDTDGDHRNLPSSIPQFPISFPKKFLSRFYFWQAP